MGDDKEMTELNEDFLNISIDDANASGAGDEVDDVVKHTSDTISAAVEDTMRRVVDIWAQIGLPVHRRKARMDEIIELIGSTLFGCFETEQTSLVHLINYKETRFKQINDMLAALHLPPYSMPTDVSLLATGRLLKAKFDELEKVRISRMDRLEELRQRHEGTCKRLGEPVPPLKLKTSIPSEEELVELKESLNKLLAEHRKRKQEFVTVKQSFDDIAAEIEFEPKTEFEKEMVSGTEETVMLSKANIKKFVELHNRLDKLNEQNQIKKREMFDRLEYLWDQLNIEESERQEIAAQYVLNSKRILESLKTDQLDKLEAIRKSRIGQFIKNIEPETREWWKKCCISVNEQEGIRNHFADLEPESEELLEAWETELARLKAYYAEFEQMFKDIELLYSCWDELEEIELSANDPERYKSRRIPSTQIMKEQQRKRKLEAQIKKIEKDLTKLSIQREKDDQPLFISDIPLRDLVMTRRAIHDKAKENEKHAKKVEKKLKIHEEMHGLKVKGGGVVLRKTPVKRNGGTYTVPSPTSPNKVARKLILGGSGSGKKRDASPNSAETVLSGGNAPSQAAGKLRRSVSMSKIPQQEKGNFRRTLAKLRSNSQHSLNKAHMGSQESLLSVSEEEFQAGITRRRRPELNSTSK